MFPGIANYAVTQVADASATTTPSVTIPAGVTGDSLLVFVATDGPPTITFPAGYTAAARTTDSGNAVSTAVAYRVTDGSEGASLTVTLSAAEAMVAIVLRLPSVDGTPEAATPASSPGSSSIDPPALTVSWGAADNLFLWFYGQDGVATSPGTNTISDRSEGILSQRSGAGAGDIYGALGGSTSLLATRDPAAINLTGSAAWVAQTYGIRGTPPAVALPISVLRRGQATPARRGRRRATYA
jgi:hypothetical protein